MWLRTIASDDTMSYHVDRFYSNGSVLLLSNVIRQSSSSCFSGATGRSTHWPSNRKRRPIQQPRLGIWRLRWQASKHNWTSSCEQSKMTKRLCSSSSGTCSTKRRSRSASNKRSSRRLHSPEKTRPPRSCIRRGTMQRLMIQRRLDPERGKQQRKAWSPRLKTTAMRPRKTSP